ncbi:DNA mismatch repair protein MutS [Macleaya cordata]|uniref:DNA mismatch repair protein MutS n=1 Tax=Macleaya cordata TaxID=56857 RepID=A0A200PQX6_MACCD|nr:DNA mismatch repair protein MutS [Macleaya cordata]
MEICNCFISFRTSSNFYHSGIHGIVRNSSSVSASPEKARVTISEDLLKESEKILEWKSVCSQVSTFISTSMGQSLARNGSIPFGRSREESQKLLNQTTAAVLLPQSLDFSGIEDITELVSSSVAGELRTVSELCAVRRTLLSARKLLEQLEKVSVDEDSSYRYTPLLEILQNCNFLTELEHKIEFCIDCNLSMILDRASDDLEIIRSERKRNMGNLESLLKDVSTRIFRAGGIDSPLVTKRRSRMCVGIRATHKSLLPDGVVLNVSSSGATYFMEPRDAVELNNMEVRLSNSEKSEELAILSLLTSDIAESESEITYLLDRILELDLASARASYARWINGVRPVIGQESCGGFESDKTEDSLLVDIEGIRHPVLLESSLRSFSSEAQSDFPVPIDIKIGCTTKVVVISGPNTGGKTASMKTLGLASLMSKAGMYLPAKNDPKLPWFDLVLADIGDHQSLEQSLSTFSGHISRISKILEMASKESLVLLDEIGSGTDPSEGVALSASILLYLKDRVNLAVVTTHYADLSNLKEKDARFENAAMEFCLETLQPTYRVLWGSTGNSNALSIAKSIGFNQKVLDRAHKWVDRLMPDKQKQRKGLLYQSLMEERNTLEAQARKAASLHSEVMEIYHEIQNEAEDLDTREAALKAKETKRIQQELKAAMSHIDAVVRDFENQLNAGHPDQFKLLVRKSEAVIASIVEAHRPTGDYLIRETEDSSYVPQIGEQVHVQGLGDKLATVVEPPGDDGMALVQYGKIKVRVKRGSIRAIPSSKRNAAITDPRPKRMGQVRRTLVQENQNEEVPYGPVIQTSKNTVDLRGMRVEEASRHLSMALSASQSKEVLFVIHGMGTGVVKERALELLSKHPRVAKFEQESPMNYGCTVAYIK